MGAEEGSKCVRPEALRSKPGDVRGQWRPVEGRATGNRPGDRAAAGSGSRTGPAGTQQKPQTCRRTWPSSLPRCDWHAPQDRVSLVVFSPPFRTKEEDLRGKCALMVSFSWEAAAVCVVMFGHGERPRSEDHAARLCGFPCRNVGAEQHPERRGCSPAVAPSPDVSLCPLLTAGKASPSSDGSLGACGVNWRQALGSVGTRWGLRPCEPAASWLDPAGAGRATARSAFCLGANVPSVI